MIIDGFAKQEKLVSDVCSPSPENSALGWSVVNVQSGYESDPREQPAPPSSAAEPGVAGPAVPPALHPRFVTGAGGAAGGSLVQ